MIFLFSLERLFDLVDVFLANFRRFRWQIIFLVRPRPEIQQLASLGAEGAKSFP